MNKKTNHVMIACAALMLAAKSVLATDGTWVSVTSSEYYSTTNAWSGKVLANGAGAVMTLDPPSAVNTTINMDTNVVLGTVQFSTTYGAALNIYPYPSKLTDVGIRYLTMDSGTPGTPALIWQKRDYNSNSGTKQNFTVPLRLNSDLMFRNNHTNAFANDQVSVTLAAAYGNIDEGVAGRSLFINNDHVIVQTSLFGSNTFSGSVVVQRGMLKIASQFAAGGTGYQLGLGNSVTVTGGVSVLDLNGFTVGAGKTLFLGGSGNTGAGALANSCRAPAYTSVWQGAVSLVANASIGKGLDHPTHWYRGNGGSLAITGDITDNGNGYRLSKSSLSTLFLRGNNTYSGGTDISNGYVNVIGVTNLGTGPVIFNGGALRFGQSFDLSARVLTNINSKVVSLDTAGFDVTLAGNLSSFANGLTKNGAGTLTLSGANGFKGVTTVNRGTLTLDYSTQRNSKLDTASSLTLGGGTVRVGGGSAFTQVVGRLTLNMGASMVTNLNTVGGPILNFGATLNRSAGGTVMFGTAGAAILLSPGLNNDLYGGFATFGDSTWAGKNGTDYNFQFITGYTGYTNTWNAADNKDITVANVGGISANAQVNSLRFNNSDSAGQPVTMTLSGTNALTSGGILVTPAMGANPVTIAGGTLTSKNGQNDLVVIQNNTNAPLVITSCITNNGASQTALTKSGPGTLAISNSASLFHGNIFVNSGALEVYSAMDLGSTNFQQRNIYLNSGSTLRLYGSYDLGTTVNFQSLVVGEGGGTVDIPNASDRVVLMGNLNLNGILTKTGAGSLVSKRDASISFEYPLAVVAEGGTLEIGSTDTASKFLGTSGTLTLRNNATLKGGGFLNTQNGRNEEQAFCVLRVEGTGGTIDLNGVSPTMNSSISGNDFLEGSGRLVITNTSGTIARFGFGFSVHNKFTGILDVPGDYLGGPSPAGALPNGELRLGPTTVGTFGYLTIPGRTFGALTGSGRFGGDGDPQSQLLCIGDNRATPFEFSGTLWTFHSGGYPGQRFAKTGSSTWRISGPTNSITTDFIIRGGTLLAGANSPGNGTTSLLGNMSVLLGDSGTGANDNLALLTDGPYLIGNTLVITNANPNGTTTLGGNQATGASSFTNALVLTRNVNLTSANTDGNGVTFSGKITGTGGITKTGVGTVYLTGAVSNTGPTVVQAGSLVVQSTITLTNTLTVTAGTGGTGTLAVTGNVTLGTGATLVVSAGSLVRSQTYTLMTWTGTRTGTFASTTGLPENWRVKFLSNSVVLYYSWPGTMIRVL
jgi:fibronectin-binding autotransporter adhesin